MWRYRICKLKMKEKKQSWFKRHPIWIGIIIIVVGIFLYSNWRGEYDDCEMYYKDCERYYNECVLSILEESVIKTTITERIIRPYKTIGEREKLIKSLMESGLTEKGARRELRNDVEIIESLIKKRRRTSDFSEKIWCIEDLEHCIDECRE